MSWPKTVKENKFLGKSWEKERPLAKKRRVYQETNEVDEAGKVVDTEKKSIYEKCVK
jgi:hypothetical protein